MQLFSSLRAVLRRLRTRAEHPAPEPLPDSFDVPVREEREELLLTISSGTVVRTALLVLLVVVGFQLIAEVVDVLLLVLVSLIIAAALIPPVDAAVRRGVPRLLATLLAYIVGLGILGAIITMLVPVVAEQVLDLAQNVRGIVEALVREGPATLPLVGPSLARFTQSMDPALLAEDLQAPLQELGKSLLSLTAGAAGAAGKIAVALLDLVGVVVISFYMVLRRSLLEGAVSLVTPPAYRKRTLALHARILTRMGSWLRAQLLVMLFAFLLSWIGFAIIGLKYALALSIMAGVLAIIPVVGWITAGIIAALIGLTQSAWIFLGAVIIIFIVHFAEAYIFIPLVTERAVGLSPIGVLISLLLGAKLAGFLGVIVAVPVATAIAVLLESRGDPGKHAAR